MEMKTRWLKRVSAWVLCFCLLGGVLLSGIVLPTKAQDAPPTAFTANFSDLALKVDTSKYDANNLYFSKYNDEDINTWVNNRFDIYAAREGNVTTQRRYLGQSSYAFGGDIYEHSEWGGEHRWQIDKNGYLRYYTSQAGGELLRKGEQLVLKTSDGAQAQLKNFRATVVFNTADHARGAVVLAFHEQTPGRFVDNGDRAEYSHNNAVIIGNADRSWESDTADTMAIRKSGNLTSKTKIATANNYAAKTALTGNLQANTDYILSVEVIGTKLTATVSTMDSTVLGKLTLNDLVPYLGTMSVGVVNSARALKSIEVVELDENGDAVDFGTHTVTPEKFTYNFNNLLTFNNGTGNFKYPGTHFYNGTNEQWWLNTTDSNVKSESKAELQYLLRTRFDEYLDATAGYVTKTDFEKNPNAGTAFGNNDQRDNAGFWQVLSCEWLQREVSNIKWRENLRLVSSLVPKSAFTGEAYTMTNFEASFVATFEYAGSGSIVIGARQQTPGKFTANKQGNRANSDQALVMITQEGFSVAGGNNITDAMYNSIAYTFSGHTPGNGAQFAVKVRMVGNNCYLQILTGGNDLFNNFAGGKDETTALYLGDYVRDGYIAFGLGEDKMGIKNISLVKLDEDGNPVDIDPYVAPEEEIIDAEQFKFDAGIGSYTGGSATLDTQEEALEILRTKFMHYYVHGDTYEDFPWYGNAGGNDGCGNWQLKNNAWLSRVDVKNGGERLRQINALIPKDANGNAAQAGNLIAEFDYRFDNAESTALFGFRQKNPARFINGTGKVNQEQVLVAINKTTLSVASGTGITAEEFYSDKATYNTKGTALINMPDEIHVRIKAVGNDCTVIISSLSGNLLFKNTFTVTNTGTGYMALGIAAGEGSIGDVTITRLDSTGKAADFTTVTDYQDKVYEDGILRFNADFKQPASLAGSFTGGVYVPTATDRTINHWFDNRFTAYFNLNYAGREPIEKNYIGESSTVYDAADSGKDAAWRGGEVYWQLEKNGYLTHYASGTGWEMMRKIQALTLKAPDGNAATVKNFEATFTVHDEKKAEGAVLLSFRNDRQNLISLVGNSIYSNQQLLAIGYDGNGNAGMNLGGNAAQFDGTYDAFKTPLDTLKGVTDYKVYVKALNDSIIVKIASTDGAAVYYDNSSAPLKAVRQDAGYMMVGVSNSTKSLVDFTVTELDDAGNPIDFGTNTGKGGVFEFSVANTVPYSNGKYENGEPWIDFVGDQVDPESATSAQMISLLNSRFAIYYNHQGRYQQTEAGLKETYSGQKNDYAFLGRLFANKWLQRLVVNSGGKQTMRLITGLVPRDTNTGEELQMKNFETSFEFRFETNGYHSEAAIIGFRQQTPGKFVNGYFNVNKEQGLVVITRHGLTVAAGEDIFSGQKMTEDGQETHQPLDGDIYDGAQSITFDDPATPDVTETLPQTIGVKVRVVNNQLWLTITDEAGAVLYNNSGNPFTVNYDKSGYVSYGLANWQAGIANIRLVRLDDNGKQIDINNSTSNPDAPWDTTADRYTQVMGSVKKDIVTALDYYYSTLQSGSTVVNRETMEQHWKLNDSGVLMRHSDLTDNATSNVSTLKWNLFEKNETIENFDAVFKLQLDDSKKGTFWVASGQMNKSKIGKITTTDGGTDYVAGQAAVGLSIGGNITVASGDGSSITVQGMSGGTPSGTYTLRVRKSGKLLEVYVNGVMRVSRTLDTSAIGKGYLYYGYSGAELGISEVNVTKLDENGVPVDFTTDYTRVQTVADQMVDKGATKAELTLPATLKIYKGLREETSNVYWDCSAIDFNTEGEYIAIGYLEKTNGIRAVAKVQVGKYNPDNTVVYSFNDSNILEKLDTYFLPEGSTGNQPAISVKDTANENWYVADGKLRIKHNSYYHTKDQLLEGFDLNGVHYQNTDKVFAGFQSNIAIAVLKEQTYKNFILDVDYRGYFDWSFVGFGADAADGNSVFGSQKDGGTTFFVAYNSGAAGINTWANGKCWNTQNSLSPYDISDGNEQHHIRIIVSDGMAYFYLDDIASPVLYPLSDDYDGGYIYLGLNSTDCYFDNLKITDLDDAAIKITDLKDMPNEVFINRALGDTISLPKRIVAVDKDGYEYTLPVDWKNADYRSGVSGDYAFAPVISLHNVKFATDRTILVKNRINGEYDETTSVKYYFDHENDLLDFNSYYSEPLPDDKVPNYWDSSLGKMYNAHLGDLTKSNSALDRWMVTANGATTVRSDSNGSYHTSKLSTNLETMTFKKEMNLNLTSYKLEMDFNHARGDWWYTYMLFGVQNPGKFVSKWQSHDGSYNQYARSNAKEGGVYYWLEQEGYFNFEGALISGGERLQLDEDYIYNNINWPDAYERDITHHMTVYVFGQRAFAQVDNSGYIEIALTPYAIGGLVGFASHGNDSTVSNFQLTAIDSDTFDPVNDTCKAIPLETAERGWAPDLSYDAYNAYVPSDEDLEYDWKEYIQQY